MGAYKSWSGLQKQLNACLCDELRDRISYFLTRYHEAHNAYGRAAICLDGREIAVFTWIEMYRQEAAFSKLYHSGQNLSGDEIQKVLKPTWDENCTYCEMDFLDAVLQFRSMPIQEALRAENYIIKILAIMDKRLGRRTLAKIKNIAEYEDYPPWVRQFYRLRLSLAS